MVRRKQIGLLMIVLLLFQGVPTLSFAAKGENIIIDNNSPGCTVEGEWTKGTYNTDFYGTNYLSDNTAGADEGKSVTFTPSIPAEAQYRIYMWWPAGSNRPSDVPIEIQHRDGIDNSITVNMRENGGQWNLLGTYILAKGGENYVKILATAEGYTMANAVRFEEVVPDPLEGIQKPVEFADVEGTAYREAANFLGTIGVLTGYEDGSFRPEDPVTRAEMAAVITRILGVSTAGLSTEPPYTDVAESHWAAADIAAATAQKIINGDGDTFRPEDPVTYEEAAKMLVCTLGYAVYAESEGGYPIGYWKLARRHNLLDGISADGAEQAIRGQIASMVYQALHAELLLPTAFGSSVTYTGREGVTLLSENLHIYRAQGVVEENDQTSLLDGASSLSEGEVRIDGAVYLYGYTDICNRLGQTAVFYYTEAPTDTTAFVILSYTLKERTAGDELTIDASKIREVQTEYGSIRLTYETEDGRLKDLSLSGAANVLWNGKRLEAYTDADLKPANGSVTLVKDAESGVYQTVKVVSYDTVVADAVFASGGVVKNKAGADFRYDVSDPEVVCTIVKNDTEITLEDIREWDVLSVQQSRDGKLVRVLVSDRSIFGMLNRLEDKEEPRTAVIDERETELTAGVEIDLTVGEEATFYLDVFGRIAAVDAQSAGKIGILKGVDTQGGLERTAMFKILDQSNAWRTLYAAGRITLNGVRQEAFVAAERLSALIGREEIGYGQIIQYRLNENEELVSINAPTLVEDAAGVWDDDTLATTGEQRSMTYRSATRSLQHLSDVTQKVYMDEQTVIVKVPKNNMDEDKEYQFYTEPAALFIDNRAYDVITFNETDLAVPDIIMVYQDEYASTSVNSSSKVMLVSYVAQGVDADGNEVRMIHGLFDGQEVSLPLAEGVTPEIFPDPEEGDLIRFNKNKDGEIAAVVQALDFDAIRTEAVRTATLTNNYLQTILGKALSIKDGKIRIETNNTDLTEKIQSVWDITNASMNVYLYEESRKSLNRGSIATVGDIIEGDLVFVQYSNFKATGLVIYKLQ